MRHRFGSTKEPFYADLSRICAATVPRLAGTHHRFAEVTPGGAWCFGAAPDEMGSDRTLPEPLDEIGTPDVIVRHMFYPAGMTAYRALVEDVLGLPLVGSPAPVTGLATSKLWTRDVPASGGVPVAEARRIEGGLRRDLPAPYVVRPDTENNSRGISIIRDPADTPAAMAEAFIPGREIRAAVIEREGDLIVPPFIETPVSEDRPIRDVADKLEGAGGALRQSTRDEAQPICPAELDDDLARALTQAATAAHRALGARHYALFDGALWAEVAGAGAAPKAA
ncbi:D-alanine--D-alanine ligase [Jannaschia seohaensis]|uniref:D-alanine-D-alanine ligase n=1 Tax=Jannaschia seohaensis TaxID=475081 RepID=A0A2Y9A0X9_9RHOB|nr:D-alanine--D-alanine ligase [Jannaschia seohaensis]PWJ21913.1 D-alanine-D-alanine ligase [Jannaschia seohaensis]SSA38191.1 D-alanine-D-alanine ligase [Jannaschia seohaensis]